MPLSVTKTPGTWVPAQNVSVADGVGGWREARSVKRTDGAGNWVIVWVPPTTATVTPPAWVLSQQSGGGAGSANVIKPATFTISLSKPLSAQTVSLQLAYSTGGWAEYGAWTRPTQTSWTHDIAFSTNGPWYVRVVVTQLDGRVVVSPTGSLTCYVKSLTTSVNDATPITGTTVQLSAACGGDCLPGYASAGWYYRWVSEGVWHWYGGGNPLAWPSGGGAIDWMWQEAFAEGSVLNSSTVRVTPQAAPVTHFHEVVPSGSSAAQIQAAMNRAKSWFLANKNAPVNFDDENTFACVELVAGGTYDLGTTALKARRGVRLVGGGSGGSRAYVASKGSHFMNTDNHGGGGYNGVDYDWMVHNLRIDCFNSSGGLSITHTRRWQVSNCHFWGMGGKKHYVEVNSSGGPRQDGTYNVRILNNEFQNNVNISTRRVEDECIQLDYSWAGAASNTANDGTITNNVLISGNYFHDAPRAIGSHHFEAGDGPKGFHANIVIQSNTFTNIDPSQFNGGDAPNSINSEGAVRAYAWQYVHILDNVFNDCFQPINLYIPADAPTTFGHPYYYRIAGNYLRNVVQNRHGIYGTSGHSSLDFQGVLIEGNIADGAWDTSPDIYFAGCDDTRGTLPASTYGCVIRNNQFKPNNFTAAEEKAYNKYRSANSTNVTGVYIANNTVSDGTVDNS